MKGIGIAAPAANYREGTIESPANLRWGNVNIVKLLRDRVGIPIELVNDGNAAALGEMKYGAAKGMNNFVVLTLGTGLGAGIVVDGKLLLGEHGAAGELGHIAMYPRERQCGCGHYGCVETYVSATGIRRTAFELMAQKLDETELRRLSYDDLTAERIFALAAEGDPLAMEAFAITGLHLGRLISIIVATFEPEAVILFGGLTNSGRLLMEPTRKSYNESVLAVFKERVKILASELNNGRAAILGASSLFAEPGSNGEQRASRNGLDVHHQTLQH
jgi:glucokinase